MQSVSLYIHFPWCARKCPYCDFNSHAVKTDIPENQYVSVLLEDLAWHIEQFNITAKVGSIFFGGGTPSLFSAISLEKLMDGIQKNLDLTEQCEITLEANPGTIDASKFHAYRALGINRLSLGVQSFHDEHLKKLGRIHSASDAKKAIEQAIVAGFDNFNLDLMFGLPGQTTQMALTDIEEALYYKPKHLSHYQLTLEPNTYFYRYPPVLPDDEGCFEIQEVCHQKLKEAGFDHYEVSAFAVPGYASRHNLNYWGFGDYIGIGAGAHGKLTIHKPDRIIRTVQARHPEQYLNRMLPNSECINLDQLPLEFMMNLLRLKNGFQLSSFEEKTGLGIETIEHGVTDCIKRGLMLKEDDHVKCSDKGWLFLDEVLQHFVV